MLQEMGSRHSSILHQPVWHMYIAYYHFRQDDSIVATTPGFHFISAIPLILPFSFS
jgi:hypothetical protein